MWATYGTTPQYGGTVFTGPQEPVVAELNGQSYAPVDHMPDWSTEYMDADGTLKARPEITLSPDTDTVPADGVTPVTFANLIDPVDVQITGPVNDSFECTGGTLKLTFAVPGEYTVRFSRFPYIDAQVVIRAT